MQSARSARPEWPRKFLKSLNLHNYGSWWSRHGPCINGVQRFLLELKRNKGESSREPRNVVAWNADSRTCRFGADVRIRDRLRKGLKGPIMLVLTSIVTLLLFIYLMAALLRPEWF
jgi:K+-transporting ATPase KdpF subunit